MSIHTSLNYLSPLPLWEHVKPYEITGRVPPGQPKTNVETTAYQTAVRDARQYQQDLGGLDQGGFAWITQNTSEPLDSEESISRNIVEMEKFLKDYLAADFVLTFQYQVRKKILDASNAQIRPPSNFVHIDVTPGGALARIQHSFPDRATEITSCRYRLISVWRPLFSPLEDYPLAVCDTRTVRSEDLVESDYVYPDFESESYMVKHNEDHCWYYLSKQAKHEVLLITNYDSDNHIRVPHTGFKLPETSTKTRPRESLEIKVLVASKRINTDGNTNYAVEA